MPSAIEIERKYDVVDGARMPGVPGLDADAPETVELSAVYWDTAEAALARAAIALRRREGGHDAGWHLKLPAALGREEVTAPLSDTVPEALLERVRDVLGGGELSELARLRTRRTITVLRDAEGRALVELADDEVAATDVRRGVERAWREWEAELLPDAPHDPEGAAALLDRVESALLAAGARPSSSLSKLARALGADALGADALEDDVTGTPGGQTAG